VLTQEAEVASEQACSQAQQELAALRENQQLDFERIGLLSEENAALQVWPTPNNMSQTWELCGLLQNHMFSCPLCNAWLLSACHVAPGEN
jgi:hypothetical protein